MRVFIIQNRMKTDVFKTSIYTLKPVGIQEYEHLFFIFAFVFQWFQSVLSNTVKGNIQKLNANVRLFFGSIDY